MDKNENWSLCFYLLGRINIKLQLMLGIKRDILFPDR